MILGRSLAVSFLELNLTDWAGKNSVVKEFRNCCFLYWKGEKKSRRKRKQKKDKEVEQGNDRSSSHLSPSGLSFHISVNVKQCFIHQFYTI